MPPAPPCALRRGLVLTEMMMTEHQSGPRRLGRSLAGTRDLILPLLGALAVPRRATTPPRAQWFAPRIRAKNSFIIDYNRRRGV